MAKKTTTVVSKKPVSTPVRNSAIPKVSSVVTRRPTEISGELVAKKAYEIFVSGKGGSELDNWFAAERELRQAA